MKEVRILMTLKHVSNSEVYSEQKTYIYVKAEYQ